ncbi:MFS transporter [Pseudomonas fluorescens]|uniref:MFS transporter n=1 Tax=Pseudomonas fluorescens TaxID=294 RepID=UPI001BE683BC|nr:MFS transporter [Pseudomonas fluorescens]MBT2370451.1 MFS transporter [Pseudomonas fluorescens]
MVVGTLRSKAQVIIAVMIFGLTYGLSAPLIALKLTSAGYSETSVGLNAAMHAVGVFIIAPFLPSLCRRVPPRTLLFVSLISTLVLLLLFPFTPIVFWFALRLGLGIFAEIILVVTETWLNQVTVEVARAKTIAIYTASLSLGFALGPVILAWNSSSDSNAFIAGALITLMAAVIILFSQLEHTVFAEDKSLSLWRFFQLAPLAMAATALNGALEAAGMNLLVLYAMSLGWVEHQATLLISVLLLGAILLQLPIGWLADRVNRQNLLVVLTLLSTLGALVWPLALTQFWLAYTLLFFWGGIFVGIYTVMITLVGQQFKGGELTGVYAAMSIAWGVGALLGPALGGMAMSLSTHGLPFLAALLCGMFLLLLLRKSKVWK